MGKSLLVLGLAAVAVLSASAASAQQSRRPSQARAPDQCFRASDWRGWKATEDGRIMYIEAGLNRVWKFEMAQPCRELNSIGAQLITRTDKPLICRPIDINLRVRQPGAGITYCQVRRLTRLTPAEARALPRALRP